MPNIVERLRSERGMSMEALAQLLDTTTSTINRIEKGETRLVSPWVEKLAKAFGVSPLEILSEELDLKPVLFPDAEAYESANAKEAKSAGRMYLCKSSALSARGVRSGDILVVDPSAPAGTGDIVLIDCEGSLYFRQYLEPALYVTNAEDDADNNISINGKTREVRVIGTVSHRYEDLRKR